MTKTKKSRKSGGTSPYKAPAQNLQQITGKNIDEIDEIEGKVRYIVSEAEKTFDKIKKDIIEKEFAIKNLEYKMNKTWTNIDRKVDETIGKKTLTFITDFVTNDTFKDSLKQLKKEIENYNQKKFENSQKVTVDFNTEINDLKKKNQNENQIIQEIKTEIENLKQSIGKQTSHIGVNSKKSSRISENKKFELLNEKFNTINSLVNEKLKIFDECNDKLNTAAHHAQEVKNNFDNILHYIEKIVKKELNERLQNTPESRNTPESQKKRSVPIRTYTRKFKSVGNKPANQYTPKENAIVQKYNTR